MPTILGSAPNDDKNNTLGTHIMSTNKVIRRFSVVQSGNLWPMSMIRLITLRLPSDHPVHTGQSSDQGGKQGNTLCDHIMSMSTEWSELVINRTYGWKSHDHWHQWIVYTVQWTLYIVQCYFTVYILHCILFSIHCTVYTTQRNAYSEQWTVNSLSSVKFLTVWEKKDMLLLLLLPFLLLFWLSLSLLFLVIIVLVVIVVIVVIIVQPLILEISGIRFSTRNIAHNGNC